MIQGACARAPCDSRMRRHNHEVHGNNAYTWDTLPPSQCNCAICLQQEDQNCYYMSPAISASSSHRISNSSSSSASFPNSRLAASMALKSFPEEAKLVTLSCSSSRFWVITFTRASSFWYSCCSFQLNCRGFGLVATLLLLLLLLLAVGVGLLLLLFPLLLLLSLPLAGSVPGVGLLLLLPFRELEPEDEGVDAGEAADAIGAAAGAADAVECSKSASLKPMLVPSLARPFSTRRMWVAFRDSAKARL
mmetsp:Transcript_1979/g.5023  ORF Transcript_1979/g.5023 Transcript_1979/m.5023 type:complete len:248 (+) Transcript_1979:85-828(+)